MDKACTRCLTMRSFAARNISAININKTPVFYKRVNKTALPTFNITRQYAVNIRTSEKKYKHGKLVTEVVEDPTLYPKFLMTFTSYDEAVLDTYFNFVKKAAKMVEVNVTKSFNMPAKVEKYKSQVGDGETKKNNEYTFKQYQRVLEISELTGEKSDFYIEYLQKKLPAGVQIAMELQRWEMLVDPDHISLRIPQ